MLSLRETGRKVSQQFFPFLIKTGRKEQKVLNVLPVFPMKPAVNEQFLTFLMNLSGRAESDEKHRFFIKSAGRREKQWVFSGIKRQKRAEMHERAAPLPRANRQESEKLSRKCRKSEKVQKR